MARAALGWSAADLVKAAKVGINAVNRFEMGADARMSTASALRRALEDAGIEFLDGDAPGVRLHPKPAGKGKTKRG